jgi:hypothetical protein
VGAPERRFACACRRLAGRLAPGGSETHALCHCRDCRAAYTASGRPDPGVTGILQTTPDRLRIERGREHLAARRLLPKGGGIRWYAACCGRPLFYTSPVPRLAIVGVAADRLSGPPLPPVACEAFVPKPGGGHAHKGGARFLRDAVTRIARANLSGSWRDSPLFDEDGKPALRPHRLTEAERAEAYGRLA